MGGASQIETYTIVRHSSLSHSPSVTFLSSSILTPLHYFNYLSLFLIYPLPLLLVYILILFILSSHHILLQRIMILSRDSLPSLLIGPIIYFLIQKHFIDDQLSFFLDLLLLHVYNTMCYI